MCYFLYLCIIKTNIFPYIFISFPIRNFIFTYNSFYFYNFKWFGIKNLFLFAFSDNILIIFLSTFVGFILLTFLAKLSSATNTIREVFGKEEEKLKKDKKYTVTDKRKEEILLEIEDILNRYKRKIIILIIIELVLMIFFWYFVIAFCHVYQGTQISWLIDSSLSILSRAIIELLISFGLAQLYRKGVDIQSHCMYKFCMFLYNFSW